MSGSDAHVAQNPEEVSLPMEQLSVNSDNGFTLEEIFNDFGVEEPNSGSQPQGRCKANSCLVAFAIFCIISNVTSVIVIIKNIMLEKEQLSVNGSSTAPSEEERQLSTAIAAAFFSFSILGLCIMLGVIGFNVWCKYQRAQMQVHPEAPEGDQERRQLEHMQVRPEGSEILDASEEQPSHRDPYAGRILEMPRIMVMPRNQRIADLMEGVARIIEDNQQSDDSSDQQSDDSSDQPRRQSGQSMLRALQLQAQRNARDAVMSGALSI